MIYACLILLGIGYESCNDKHNKEDNNNQNIGNNIDDLLKKNPKAKEIINKFQDMKAFKCNGYFNNSLFHFLYKKEFDEAIQEYENNEKQEIDKCSEPYFEHLKLHKNAITELTENDNINNLKNLISEAEKYLESENQNISQREKNIKLLENFSIRLVTNCPGMSDTKESEKKLLLDILFSKESYKKDIIEAMNPFYKYKHYKDQFIITENLLDNFFKSYSVLKAILEKRNFAFNLLRFIQSSYYCMGNKILDAIRFMADDNVANLLVSLSSKPNIKQEEIENYIFSDSLLEKAEITEVDINIFLNKFKNT